MYERKSRLSRRQQGKLLEHFVAGATARAASEVVGVNVKTATTFYMRLRHLIASKLPSYELSGEVEADPKCRKARYPRDHYQRRAQRERDGVAHL